MKYATLQTQSKQIYLSWILAMATLFSPVLLMPLQAQAVTEVFCFNFPDTTTPTQGCASTGEVDTFIGPSHTFTSNFDPLDQIIASAGGIRTSSARPTTLVDLQLWQVNGTSNVVGLGVDGIERNPTPPSIDNRRLPSPQGNNDQDITIREFIKLDLGADWQTRYVGAEWFIKIGNVTGGAAAEFYISSGLDSNNFPTLTGNLLTSSNFGNLVSFTPDDQFIYISLSNIFTSGDGDFSGLFLWEIDVVRPDVPEPSALLFIGLGLMSAIGLRLRKR